jgi:hypothetical protein
MAALAQIVAVVMLVLATGGMSFRELHGDVIEVIRRGESGKEIIIPLSDQARKKADIPQQPSARHEAEDDIPAPRTYTIDDPAAPSPKPPESGGSLPLD